MALLAMTPRVSMMVLALSSALGRVAGIRADVQAHVESNSTLARRGRGFDCYVVEREGHYHFGITLKIVVPKKIKCNYFVVSNGIWEEEVVKKYFTAVEEGDHCKCVHDDEVLCRFVPKKFVDAKTCDPKSCFSSYSHQLHVASKRQRSRRKISEFYSMIHEFNHYKVDKKYSGTETSPTVLETVKALAEGDPAEEAILLKELGKNGAAPQKAKEEDNEPQLTIPEEPLRAATKPLVKVVVMNGQEEQTGEIPDPVRLEEGGGTTPVVVSLEDLPRKMSQVLSESELTDEAHSSSEEESPVLNEEDQVLVQSYMNLATEDVKEMEKGLPTVSAEAKVEAKEGPKPLRGVLTLKSGGVTCGDVAPPSPDLVCGEITYATECAAATVMLEGQWSETGSSNKLGKQPFQDLTKGGSQSSFAPHCSAKVVEGDRWFVKFNGANTEHAGKAGPDDKLICGCWAKSGKMSKPKTCDASLKGVQCMGAPITWPTFMHIYAETVMNAAWAKELGIEFGRQMVSEAWNDYKTRCPGGLGAPGVLQPCHSLPPANVGGVRMGIGSECVIAYKEGGHVSKTPVHVEGNVLGTQCTKFAVLPVSERAGRLQDGATGLCLGLHSAEDRTLVTSKCGEGYDMWRHVEDREELPICVADPQNPENYKTVDGQEYCLGFA